jgi:hypothetical protein
MPPTETSISSTKAIAEKNPAAKITRADGKTKILGETIRLTAQDLRALADEITEAGMPEDAPAVNISRSGYYARIVIDA